MIESTVEDIRNDLNEMAFAIRTKPWDPKVTGTEEVAHAISGLLGASDARPLTQAAICGNAAGLLAALLVERDFWREQALRCHGTWPTLT